MAIIDAKGNTRGKYLKATFRVMNGKNIMQGKGGSKKLTPKSRQTASDFGRVQKSNKLLRNPIQDVLNNNHCKKMYMRLNSLVLKQFHLNDAIPQGQRTFLNTDLSSLIGFDFNSNSPFKQYCTLPIKFIKQDNKELLISIDSFKTNDYFIIEGYTSQIKVELYILYQQISHPQIRKYETISFTVTKNEEFSAKEWLVTNSLSESITLVVGQLWYIKTTVTKHIVMINSKDFHPSSILYIDNYI